ncbi:hypothetical protein KPH14_013033, partial [Odynerus spinipes]
MSTVEDTTDQEFTLVEKKKRREKKRKAPRPIESDTDVTAREEETSDASTRKKKRAPKVSIPGDADKSVVEAPKSLKERASVATRKVIELVTGAGLDPATTRGILATFAEMQEILNEALLQKSYLEGRIDCMRTEVVESNLSFAKKVEEKIQEVVPVKKPLSYAERVGVKARNVASTVIREPRNLVTVFAKDKESGKSSDDIKEALKKLVSPREEGIGIRNVRKIHGNGILIETDRRS